MTDVKERWRRKEELQLEVEMEEEGEDAEERRYHNSDPGKKIRYGSGKFGTGTSSRFRTGNLFSVGTGTEIST